MTDHFYNYLKKLFPITEEEFEMISAVTIQKSLRKKKFLLQEEDIWRNNAFVSKGLLRIYSIDDRGLEHILGLSVENNWTGDIESYTSGMASNLNIDALEDSEILLISKDNFKDLLKKIPGLDTAMKKLFEISFIESQNRILSNISLSAEQKYHNFTNTFPEISGRIPQHMIASYLGITAETLSRIKTHNTIQK